MQKGQKEVKRFKSGLCEIVDPLRLDDLATYCAEENITIIHCYGYGQDYCPRTCTYAKEKANSNTSAKTRKYEK